MFCKTSALAVGLFFMVFSGQGVAQAQVTRMWTLQDSGYTPVHNISAYFQDAQPGGTWIIELDGPLAVALMANSGGAAAGELTVYEFDKNAPGNAGRVIASDCGFLGNWDHRPAVVLISPQKVKTRRVLVQTFGDVSVKFAK